jgi:hypothetical protein
MPEGMIVWDWKKKLGYGLTESIINRLQAVDYTVYQK